MQTYTVTAVNARGIYYRHHVGATSIDQAVASVLAADPRLIRAVKVLPYFK